MNPEDKLLESMCKPDMTKASWSTECALWLRGVQITLKIDTKPRQVISPTTSFNDFYLTTVQCHKVSAVAGA